MPPSPIFGLNFPKAAVIRLTVLRAHVFTRFIHGGNHLIERNAWLADTAHRHVAALIAFTDEIAFRSTQGIVPPANRIAGQSEMVLHGDFCGIQHLSN
jgi:hypothetical protein